MREPCGRETLGCCERVPLREWSEAESLAADERAGEGGLREGEGGCRLQSRVPPAGHRGTPWCGDGRGQRLGEGGLWPGGEGLLGELG
jgi:hypothetical protein